MTPRIEVLFVCMGNICRSPTAEGVFRHLVAEARLTHLISVDSAGTHGYHIGAPPDARARAAAARRNYDLSRLRARQVAGTDFERFDYVLAMDRENLSSLEAIRPPNARAEVGLLLAYARRAGKLEVPDPYYGGARGFEHVLDLIEDASSGLLDHLRRRLAG
jgi:protein-tyrosine phosphatase